MTLTNATLVRVRRTLSTAVAATMVLTLFASVGWAKDRDGSRMHGKSVAMGHKVSDKLDGSKDKADWRYVELRKAATLKVVVTLKPKSSAATVKITDAKGNTLAESAQGSGARKLSAKVQPGIYYIEVASGAQVSYTLVVHAD